MSIAVMTEVWKDAPVAGTELLMLLALADSANDDRECWPSLRHLQHKVRVSRNQTYKLLKSLERQGLIEIGYKKGRGKPGMETNMYRILPGIAQDTTPGIAQDTTPGISGDTVNPLNESSIDPLSADADAGKPEPVPAAQMNPMKDAIAAAFGYDWKTMTKTEKGLVQKTARELCLAGVKPEQIGALYRYCSERFTAFKPGALSGNVSDWRKTTPQTTLKPEQVGDPHFDLDVKMDFDPFDNFFKPEAQS